MSRNNRYGSILFQILLFVGMFLLSACSQVAAPTAKNEATPSPTEGNVIEMTATSPTPADPGLQNLIEKAKTDLAQRLAVPVNEILLLQAESVTWPDASLGCPQEGMLYAQVLTPGYLIRFQYGNQVFEYHAGTSTSIVYCENPSPPVPGTPGDI